MNVKKEITQKPNYIEFKKHFPININNQFELNCRHDFDLYYNEIKRIMRYTLFYGFLKDRSFNNDNLLIFTQILKKINNIYLLATIYNISKEYKITTVTSYLNNYFINYGLHKQFPIIERMIARTNTKQLLIRFTKNICIEYPYLEYLYKYYYVYCNDHVLKKNNLSKKNLIKYI